MGIVVWVGTECTCQIENIYQKTRGLNTISSRSQMRTSVRTLFLIPTAHNILDHLIPIQSLLVVHDT